MQSDYVHLSNLLDILEFKNGVRSLFSSIFTLLSVPSVAFFPVETKYLQSSNKCEKVPALPAKSKHSISAFPRTAPCGFLDMFSLKKASYG